MSDTTSNQPTEPLANNEHLGRHHFLAATSDQPENDNINAKEGKLWAGYRAEEEATHEEQTANEAAAHEEDL